jgi:hypothetical protein
VRVWGGAERFSSLTTRRVTVVLALLLVLACSFAASATADDLLPGTPVVSASVGTVTASVTAPTPPAVVAPPPAVVAPTPTAPAVTASITPAPAPIPASTPPPVSTPSVSASVSGSTSGSSSGASAGVSTPAGSPTVKTSAQTRAPTPKSSVSVSTTSAPSGTKAGVSSSAPSGTTASVSSSAPSGTTASVSSSGPSGTIASVSSSPTLAAPVPGTTASVSVKTSTSGARMLTFRQTQGQQQLSGPSGSSGRGSVIGAGLLPLAVSVEPGVTERQLVFWRLECPLRTEQAHRTCTHHGAGYLARLAALEALLGKRGVLDLGGPGTAAPAQGHGEGTLAESIAKALPTIRRPTADGGGWTLMMILILITFAAAGVMSGWWRVRAWG